MKHPRPIVRAIKTINGGKKLDYGYLSSTKNFNLIIEKDHGVDPKFGSYYIIYWGYKKTFDRWANSRNFKTVIHHCPQNKNQRYDNGRRIKEYSIPDLKKVEKWCVKVVKSKVFDFTRYSKSIETPFLFS